MKEKVNTHKVLDLVYTSEEGQDAYVGTLKDCHEFVKDQGDSHYTYRVVPLTKEEFQIHNPDYETFLEIDTDVI